jgi:putative ABC transport system ATP-binding protein
MSSPVIELVGVEKIYRSGEIRVKAVRAVDLAIERGDFVAIMGPSGSGKSTLMNVLGCLDEPTAGEYLLDGVAVGDLDRRELARIRNAKLGFVFQSFNLLARSTAVDNVELPLYYGEDIVSGRDRRRRAVATLQRLGLGDRLNHLPNQLSGGQQQRIAIARALVNEPQVLLADEPTGNLDTSTSVEIMAILEELNDSGITIVLVTHELDIAGFCKRIVLMRDGRIVRDGVNEGRRFAAHELAALRAAEQDASIE